MYQENYLKKNLNKFVKKKFNKNIMQQAVSNMNNFNKRAGDRPSCVNSYIIVPKTNITRIVMIASLLLTMTCLTNTLINF